SLLVFIHLFFIHLYRTAAKFIQIPYCLKAPSAKSRLDNLFTIDKWNTPSKRMAHLVIARNWVLIFS
ncbi:MAG: hypothetical protein MJA27_30610, partial [Pseudanabaenales cyanobacterium]|nr:hypothetical protein [Pseudanabaenales cyanobacterium]